LSVAGQVVGQNFVATSTTAASTFGAAITVGAGQGNSTFGGALTLSGTSGTTMLASGQGFTIGSSQFVLQQGSGNVGIGTAIPGAALDVRGNFKVLPAGSASSFLTMNLTGSDLQLNSDIGLVLSANGAGNARLRTLGA